MEETRQKIEEILKEKFNPGFLQVEDDSGRHAGHIGARSGGGHYKVVLSSTVFTGLSLMEQHRLVNEALQELFGKEIHALALKTSVPG